MALYGSNDSEGEKKKPLINQSKIFFNGNENCVGNHGAGHMPDSTLNEGKTNADATDSFF